MEEGSLLPPIADISPHGVAKLGSKNNIRSGRLRVRDAATQAVNDYWARIKQSADATLTRTSHGSAAAA